MSDLFTDQNAATPEPKAGTPAVPQAYSTSYYSRQQSAPPPPPPLRESAARERVKRRRTGGTPSGSEWAWVIIAGTLFAVVLVVSVSALVFIRAAQNNVEVLPTADYLADLPTPFVAHTSFGDNIEPGDALVLPDGSSIALVPWDGQSRFTMILAGLDRRPGDTGLNYRTDSMMLISLDPAANSLGILSIPRDLYVQIPGAGDLQRVNTPMVFGESRCPGCGPRLLMQTVQLNLGIRVNDYMLVDFDAVITLVDILGGVEVELDYTINDPQYPNMYYGYDPFYLPAGTHLLNGYNALRFARTRHGSSDIQRAERQQQVITSIRQKVLDGNMIPTLVLRSPEIWANLADNMYTGLSLEQIIQLGLYVKDVPLENIKRGVIDYKYLRSYETNEGAQVLIPNRASLGTLMTEVFGANYSQ
ncbi:MAG: LCP family protein [Anaerolineae bacterium]|nr:LCP family protein [Anaerolineae bacterium]